MPCFVILRKDKTDKICKVAQVELNCESYLTKEVVMGLLYEAKENFSYTANADKTFVRNFEEKLNRRRQVTDMIQQGIMPVNYPDPYNRG
jgi:RNase H-fold protein (predicted Holliday junction resolvase)